MNKLHDFLPTEKYGCIFKFVDVQDAEFIAKLRSNQRLSKHISKTSPNVLDQQNWIRNYKLREKLGQEYYIICIDKKTNKKLGLSRIYNIEENVFEIGSWLFERDADYTKAILTDLFTRTLAFENLKLQNCVFEVRKLNKSVVRYHKSFNPKLVKEDNLNYYFSLTYNKFKINKNKLLKLLNYD